MIILCHFRDGLCTIENSPSATDHYRDGLCTIWLGMAMGQACRDLLKIYTWMGEHTILYLEMPFNLTPQHHLHRIINFLHIIL